MLLPSVSERNFRDRERDGMSVWFMESFVSKAFNTSLDHPFFLCVKES